jgi:hypothetical protein
MVERPRTAGLRARVALAGWITGAVILALAPGVAAGYEEEEIRPGDLDPATIVLTHPDMPARGATMERVRNSLGEPANRIPAVGDPPISSWIYDDFIVYFEHDRVLHSVIPGGRRHGGSR